MCIRDRQKLEGLGGKVLLRMRQPDPRSTVLTPGIVDVTGIEVPDEEYFGPLLTIIRYDGFPEAIRLANQTLSLIHIFAPEEAGHVLYPLKVADGHPAGVADNVRHHDHAALGQHVVRFRIGWALSLIHI